MSDLDFTDDHATLGDRIARAREAQGLTQGQLAARLGVRAKTLRDWEDDRSEPRANRLQMLAALLGVSLRWMMTGEGEGGPSALTVPEGPGLAVAGALAELRGLRGEMQGMAERMARLEKGLRAALAQGAAHG